MVKRDSKRRVYMIIKDASTEYQEQTGHNRESIGEKENYEYELGKQTKLI